MGSASDAVEEVEAGKLLELEAIRTSAERGAVENTETEW